jgi:hypothetical protein
MIIFVIITIPIGFVVAIFKTDSFGRYCTYISTAISQMINTVCAPWFNSWLITKDGHEFGNSKETTSSVIGTNYLAATLTRSGERLNNFLNWIEKDHTTSHIQKDI